MDKIGRAIKVLKDRVEAFKIARSVVRYDSTEKAIIDVRMEDLNYLLVKLIEIEKEKDELSAEPVRKDK